MYHILFLDDDINILQLNRLYFEEKNFLVHTAANCNEATVILHNFPIDCAIMDILMPEEDGLHFCKKLRSEQNIPIIFLSNLSQKDFLYRGFNVGGDDYITKPYDLTELELRIFALIKRSKGLLAPNNALVFPPLSIDPDSRTVLVNETPILLTNFEFDTLLLLASQPNKVFSLGTIYREVWRMPDLNSMHTVQVHLARLRRKLEDACPERSFLGTVWKKGYKFTPDEKKL